jgi:O-antigen ligase
LLVGTAAVQASAGAGYLADVTKILLLGVSVVLVSLVLRPGGILVHRRRVLPVLVFAAVACLSVVASPAFHSSLARLELYYAVAVVGLAIGLALPRCHHGVGLAILLAIAVVHGGFLLIAVQSAIAAAGEPDPLRTVPYFANIRHFGYQGFFGASAAVAVAVLDRRTRAAGILLAAAALFGIVMFGSRGALLAWFVFVAVAAVLLPARRALLTMSAVALVVAVVLTVIAERYDWLNTVSLLDRAQTRGDALQVAPRLDIWRDALAAIARRPLLGFGPEGFQISDCCDPQVVQPHNSILQVLLEFGVIGLAALLWSVLAVFGSSIREVSSRTARQDRDAVRTAALSIAVGFLAYSFIDGLLYYPVPLVNVALVCAVLLAAPTSAGATPARSADRLPIQSPASSPDT